LGCASTETKIPPVLSEELKSRLNTVGFAASQSPPEPKLGVIPKGSMEGAGEGIKAGASAGATPGVLIGSTGEPILAVIGTIVAVAGGIIGGVAGGVYGAVTADPAEQVEQFELALSKAIAKLEIQENLQQHVMEEAGRQTKYGVISLSAIMDGEGNREATYMDVMNTDTGAVLETNVLSFGLVKQYAAPVPPTAVFIDVQVRLIELKGGDVLYEDPFSFVTDFHEYTHWADEGGQRFLDAINEGYHTLAEEIVYEIFLRPE
jgi:hypothetical protein